MSTTSHTPNAGFRFEKALLVQKLNVCSTSRHNK